MTGASRPFALFKMLVSKVSAVYEQQHVNINEDADWKYDMYTLLFLYNCLFLVK